MRFVWLDYIALEVRQLIGIERSPGPRFRPVGQRTVKLAEHYPIVIRHIRPKFGVFADELHDLIRNLGAAFKGIPA